MIAFKIGDRVGYKSMQDDAQFQNVGEVYDIWEDGIPSCREPMLKIKGKAGCVLASHCTILPTEEKAITCPADCGGCSCHIAPPCGHCIEHVNHEENQ